jgi:hypothetical protein
MAKMDVDRQDQTLTLVGFQSEVRMVEALQVRIDYQSPRWTHLMRADGENCVFSFSNRRGTRDFSPMRPTTNLDPFAVRQVFEAVSTPEQAAKFLSEAGRFWPFERVTWKQFREWQAFLRWLRLDPESAKQHPEGKKAWDASAGFGDEFFFQSDEDFTRSRFPSELHAKIGPTEWKKIQLADRDILWALRRFMHQPHGPNLQARVELMWYDESHSHFPENRKSRHEKAPNHVTLAPYLHIEALNVLEAVSGTIFADRAHGMRFGRCKHCHRTFKIESEHGQEFCAAPVHLRSSPCKNAYLQTLRRGNEKQAISFLLQSWSKELTESEIRNEAQSSGIQLKPAIVAKAEKRWSRMSRKVKGEQNGSL